MRKAAELDDKDQIYHDDFIKTCLKFKVKLSESQLENLRDSFPGRKDGDRQRLNISRFYDLNLSILQHNVYKQLEVRENQDEVHDASGYTGQMHRKKEKLQPATESDFLNAFLGENKLDEISRLLREIDQAKTGFVTKTELADILRLLYEDELGEKDLEEFLEPYCSSINKILVDYRAFKEYLFAKLKSGDTTHTLRNVDEILASRNQSLTRSVNKNDGTISAPRVRSGSQSLSREPSPIGKSLKRSRDFFTNENQKLELSKRKSID